MSEAKVDATAEVERAKAAMLALLAEHPVEPGRPWTPYALKVQARPDDVAAGWMSYAFNELCESGDLVVEGDHVRLGGAVPDPWRVAEPVERVMWCKWCGSSAVIAVDTTYDRSPLPCSHTGEHELYARWSDYDALRRRGRLDSIIPGGVAQEKRG